MAPKKQPARNAFYYYMLDMEKDLKKHGKTSGGMKDLADAASPSWKLLSPSEKKPYEDMANAHKGGTKYTSHGQTYEEVEREKQALIAKEELMLKTIQTTLVNLGRNTGLAYHPFILFHMNYFCKTGDGVYYPAEVAATAFTVKNGVATPFHTLVNPGPLPTGYAYKAQQTSMETHQIDVNKHKHLGEENMEKIVAELDAYVKKYPEHQGEMPPFYTLEKFVPSAEEILTRWAAAYGKPKGYYRVFRLEELFHQMKNFSMKPIAERRLIDGRPDEGFVYSSLAAKMLGDDPYSYRPNIACALHEEIDVVQHCSRSYVIRWGWIVADNVCENLDVQMIPGQHCPRENVVPQLEVRLNAAKLDDSPAKPAPKVEPIDLRSPPRAAGRGLTSTPIHANPWKTIAPPSSSAGSVAGSVDQFADDEDDEENGGLLRAARCRQERAEPLRMPRTTPVALGRGKLLLQDGNGDNLQRQRFNK